MARRGFLAELQHLARVNARANAVLQRGAVREHNAALRRVEEARRAAAAALARCARASAAEGKRLEREAREAHVAAMEADADARNLSLQAVYSDIDSLLASTLIVDDYVNLEALRVVAKHPPFESHGLDVPLPPPEPHPLPPQPLLLEPAPPKGLTALFTKRRHADLVAQAQEAHQQALRTWRVLVRDLSVRREAELDAHTRAEADRRHALASAQGQYARECATREAEATETNRRLDELIANLGYGAAGAVQEYLSIVLANSVYPEHFSVSHEFEFEPTSAELKLKVLVPGPDSIPNIKAYKYTKATDEITATTLPQKACRERYAGAVHQVAIRSLHEVFEADRRGLVTTISLEVGCEATDPATGRLKYVPFVVVGAERKAFQGFDLSAVVPLLTLEHLGAAVSKNPYSLVGVETTGVRRS